MQPIEIRSAESTDAEAITQLVNRSYRPATEAEKGWTHEAALVEGDRIDVTSVTTAIENTAVLVGLKESRVVGCVQIELHGRAAHIGMLAVDPALQQAGLGKLLLARAEKFSFDHYAEEAKLIVIAARKELTEFYLRRGYRKTNERLPYPLEAGVGVPSERAMSLAVLKKTLTKTMPAIGKSGHKA